jgi:hypothetical protein
MVSTVLFFVSFAFYTWDANPANWEPFTRGIFVFSSITSFVFEAIAVSYLNEKMNNKIFCYYHGKTKENPEGTDCFAHLQEGRVFKCKHSFDTAKIKCVDFKEKNNEHKN